MKQLIVTSLGVLVIGAGTVQAQTPGGPSAGYAEVTFGPTFGHTASASAGGEAGYWLTHWYGVFGEAGVMNNVATSSIDAKAKHFADGIGATAKAKQRAVYGDGGLIARFSARGRFTPYALLGLGVARVTDSTAFAAGGKDITSQLPQMGAQLGTDLAGNYSKFFVTAGGGAHVALTGRWIADVSYRYGNIGKNAASESAAINTNRLQFGIGAKF